MANSVENFLDFRILSSFSIDFFFLRPLPDEYLHYAREDTHYLLYIYDLLRNRLLEIRNQNPQLLTTVYEKSKIICQKVTKTFVFLVCRRTVLFFSFFLDL